MDTSSVLPAQRLAERIVRHFQSEGFAGISEALIVRIALRKGDRAAVDAAFAAALSDQALPPVHEWFEIRAVGHFSDFRDFAAAKSAIQTDFTVPLRRGIPALFFDPAPVLIDDALATGTKYDAMVKLRDNKDGQAFAVLLNDPDASFLDYLGSHHGTDWEKIIGDFGSAATSFGAQTDLL